MHGIEYVGLFGSERRHRNGKSQRGKAAADEVKIVVPVEAFRE